MHPQMDLCDNLHAHLAAEDTEAGGLVHLEHPTLLAPLKQLVISKRRTLRCDCLEERSAGQTRSAARTTNSAAWVAQGRTCPREP